MIEPYKNIHECLIKLSNAWNNLAPAGIKKEFDGVAYFLESASKAMLRDDLPYANRYTVFANVAMQVVQRETCFRNDEIDGLLQRAQNNFVTLLGRDRLEAPKMRFE